MAVFTSSPCGGNNTIIQIALCLSHAFDGRSSSPLFTARVTHLTVTGALEHSFLKHSFTLFSTNPSQTFLFGLPLHSMLALFAASSIVFFSFALLARVELTAVMPDPHLLPQ